MTRVIAGAFKGRRLRVPPRGTRPTTDRVKEAVFGRLDAWEAIRGARVLDAFAGSGSLGIEALSRGADRAVFVESEETAVRAIWSNLEDLRLRDRGTVVRTTVERHLASSSEEFDLVFLDPPYDLDSSQLASALVALAPRLAPQAVIVLESGSRGLDPVWPDGIVLDEVREYGDTRISFASARLPSPEGGTLDS